MNNEIKLIEKNIPSEALIGPTEPINNIWRHIALASYSFGLMFFIINIIMCLLTIKKMKQSRILLTIAIIVMCISCMGYSAMNMIRNY